MSDTTYFVTKNGLKCIFVSRKGFIGKYAGIGCHFGGAHRKYYKNGKLYESKTGIAHFLEHKAFMIDSHDALFDFDLLNADANAYTTHEQTVYYFTTNDEIYEPLKLLIRMYFTKGYTKENIETEKPIIISELEEAMDDCDKRIHDKCMKLLYPKDSYSIEILGEKEDIKNMSYDDLDMAFESFYSPKNSYLTIVGDLDFDKVKLLIEEEMAKFEFMDNDIKMIPFIESKSVNSPITIYEDIPYPELHIMGRIESLNYYTPLIPNKMISLLDCIFSVEAPFYKELQEKNLLILDDIEYSIGSHEFGSYFIIDIYTNNPEELKDLILDKLKNLSESDFNKDISMATIKSYKSDCIRALDSISYIGDETLSLAIEGPGYEEEKRVLLSTKEEDIKAFISYIRNSLMTYLIALPKNVKKDN
ncbi:putative Zn-dependent peptidase [Anaeroplasma bactoclasticum]|jgi:predicted Zn-dependent peptidase|uniref:Putative Zn-dependent peptidase n=1 Tax=Anaeroplasma bactoclasticum TaxID=2088 RepID=A0A397S165_9MOLU|nr:pitrilysin family protein [Anaeroplasma bactoclasticum]RIA75944.1 putative Zn-dependent peptidase [Anaeroplasma bactoclasticum]